MSSSSEYNARHLSVLEGLEAVRKRPGMYIGSTDSRGLMHCLWEIIDNSVDEALGGFGQSIAVTLHAGGAVEVEDNGRGIPVDIEPRTGLSGVEVVFTKLHAGGKFGGGSYGASGGLHGVGASVVNALSSRLDVQVFRGGKIHQLSFHRGEPGQFRDTGAVARPDAPFTPSANQSPMEIVGKAKRGQTGTRVRYWADEQIFTPDAKFSYEDLQQRARQTAYLIPGLKITLRDERRLPNTPGEAGPYEEVFHYDGGISEFVDHLSSVSPVTDVWRLQGAGTFTERVPVLGEDGRSAMQDVERECAVDIALRWDVGYDTHLRSFVNIIATPKGGTHQAGFEQSVLKTFRKTVEANARKLKAGNDKLEKDDVLAGMTAVLTVRLAEPQFEGQTKEVLGTSAVRQIVARVVEQQLGAIFKSTKKHEKTQVSVLLEKVVAEMKSRISARTHKENQRRKNALETSTMPAKLADCRSTDVASSELFIVEGDSALGTAKLARSSDFQALFPIRGKILNVQKASVGDMLSNAECAALIQVVGGGAGRSFDLSAARYGKVILMTDADVDGAHIRTLLLTLFFRYMRPMVEEGRVFAAVPPLHRVEVIHSGAKPNEVVYTYSEQELHRLLTRLEQDGKNYKEPIQRYKGLGEMDADQLADTTMDPRQRMLRRVTIPEAEEALQRAEHVFDLLMGSNVAPRKDFIISGAQDLDLERIDT
ncbi:DNA topoisomerase IV subunit B [Citricoccus nitrophenolicus]|uniref:DNA topoisomerase (ATP-hydrolyzing) n=1 Tax=Citricoccus nitrophenolicus TaxID=863575 RepID=A0ABV0IL59_9MICC|nr:DNA topoisomerase IV subunit B [Citricoccus sp. I39-566]WMY77588.1 DNA topoisomerase IV subunit B [Citricoccus sp. I39-566]